jgi:hypothetical protein
MTKENDHVMLKSMVAFHTVAGERRILPNQYWSVCLILAERVTDNSHGFLPSERISVGANFLMLAFALPHRGKFRHTCPITP